MSIRDIRGIIIAGLALIVVSGVICWHSSFWFGTKAEQMNMFWGSFTMSVIGIILSSGILLFMLNHDSFGTAEYLTDLMGVLVFVGAFLLMFGGVASGMVGDGTTATVGMATFLGGVISFVLNTLISLLANMREHWISGKSNLSTVRTLDDQRRAG